MAYRGPQQEIQRMTQGNPNNGNPNGVYNQSRGNTSRNQMRYTPPVVDSQGRVTNSDFNQYFTPRDVNFRTNYGLPQGANPMDFLSQMFSTGSGMFNGNEMNPYYGQGGGLPGGGNGRRGEEEGGMSAIMQALRQLLDSRRGGDQLADQVVDNQFNTNPDPYKGPERVPGSKPGEDDPYKGPERVGGSPGRAPSPYADPVAFRAYLDQLMGQRGGVAEHGTMPPPRDLPPGAK